MYLVQPNIEIVLITPQSEFTVGGTIELYCHTEGIKSNSLHWSHESKTMPVNTRVSDDGHLWINEFNKDNLGGYICAAETYIGHRSRAVYFQPDDITGLDVRSVRPSLNLQIFSSRTDYRLGGRLVVECVSSDPKATQKWNKQVGRSFKTIVRGRFLIIERLARKDLGRYQCLASNAQGQSTINLDIRRRDLIARSPPIENNRSSIQAGSRNLHFEFRSALDQLQLGGAISIVCSSLDGAPVRWIDSGNEVSTNGPLLHFTKFSTEHFGRYRCSTEKTFKTLALLPNLFSSVRPPSASIYKESFIELIRGRYVGDNVTLICRVGLDAPRGKVAWSNIPTDISGVSVRGPRLEFRPFKLEHHNNYRCRIESRQRGELWRTLTFNSQTMIRDQPDQKPKLNLTIDVTRLLDYGELRLICATENLRNHQWTFNQLEPRAKVHLESSVDSSTSTMIVPDFDMEADSGDYACLSTNAFGSTKVEIIVDKTTVAAATAATLSKRKRQIFNKTIRGKSLGRKCISGKHFSKCANRQSA